MTRGPENCDTCTGSRYCAPARCYCGHDTCPAYATWIDVRALPFNETTTKPKRNSKRSSWDDRKEATWIDAL